VDGRDQRCASGEQVDRTLDGFVECLNLVVIVLVAMQ
jgi:hypothetical protein